MPIPSTIADLSQTAADNYPTGSEVIGSNLDNYLRAHAGFIKSFYSLASSEITAASTVDVASADGESVVITGQATIASLGTGFNGCLRELRFDDTCTLTHSSDLALPGNEDISTADGDVLTFRCVGSGAWVFVSGSTGVSSSGGGSSGGSIHQVVMTTNRTLELTDVGKHIYRTGGNTTIPQNSSVAFPIGSAVTIVNKGDTAMSLLRGHTSITLIQANNTGTISALTLNARGICTLLKTATNEWFASGPGLS